MTMTLICAVAAMTGVAEPRDCIVSCRQYRTGDAECQPAPHLSTDRRRPLCDDHVESSAEGVA